MRVLCVCASALGRRILSFFFPPPLACCYPKRCDMPPTRPLSQRTTFTPFPALIISLVRDQINNSIRLERQPAFCVLAAAFCDVTLPVWPVAMGIEPAPCSQALGSCGLPVAAAVCVDTGQWRVARAPHPQRSKKPLILRF
jgi:hypothetical protein